MTTHSSTHHTDILPRPLGLAPSFGFGDRVGLATPGHVAALREAGGGILPIFAQQSIREMTRTGRSPDQVMADALAGAAAAGYTGPMGADADHLKTAEDVDRTAAAGFVFFTIDPSAHVDAQADTYDAARLDAAWRAVQAAAPWVAGYAGRSIPLGGGRTAALTDADCRRAAVKYGRAVNYALDLARHIDAVMRARGLDYEIELSVDETPQPTSPAEHYIVADRCLREGMRLVSLAPRFVGDFEKGVDYKGDLAAFDRNLADHAAIAAALGPYKLSLHSGSDKLSIYAALARATRGRFHVKTAGTSYLEALRVVALRQPRLFRELVDFARGRYETDRASYHVSATLAGTPAPADLADDAALMKAYLGVWAKVPAGRGFVEPGRQILHCTFGSVVAHAQHGPALRDALQAHRPDYDALLAYHFARHLELLS
jgi:hypothetical protein